MSKCKYISDLRKQVKRTEKAIKKLEKETQMPQAINDEFMEKYRALNELRIELKTVKSRINNYRIYGVVLYNFDLPNNISNQ